MNHLFPILTKNEDFKSGNQLIAREGLFSILQSINRIRISGRYLLTQSDSAHFHGDEIRHASKALKLKSWQLMKEIYLWLKHLKRDILI